MRVGAFPELPFNSDGVGPGLPVEVWSVQGLFRYARTLINDGYIFGRRVKGIFYPVRRGVKIDRDIHAVIIKRYAGNLGAIPVRKFVRRPGGDDIFAVKGGVIKNNLTPKTSGTQIS
ncbi:hypothetical protein ES703_101072 [subsurface metagenome]